MNYANVPAYAPLRAERLKTELGTPYVRLTRPVEAPVAPAERAA